MKNRRTIKSTEELKVQLRKRGYNGKDIEKQLHKVDTLKREDLLSVKSKEKKEDRVPLVLTYSRHLPESRKIVWKHLPVLHRSDRMTEVFQKPPIVAYRRDKNLADTLVHGKTDKALKQKDSTCSCRVCTEKRYGALQVTPNTRQLRIQVAAIGMLSMHSFAANVRRLCMWEKQRGH